MDVEFGWYYYSGDFHFHGEGESQSIKAKVTYRKDNEGGLHVVLRATGKNRDYARSLYGTVIETKPYKQGFHRITKVQVDLDEQYIYLVPDRVLLIKDTEDFKQVFSSWKFMIYLAAMVVIIAVANAFHIWFNFLGGIIFFVVYTVVYAKFVGFTQSKSLCTTDE